MRKIYSQQQWIIFASSTEMLIIFTKKIVVPLEETENGHVLMPFEHKTENSRRRRVESLYRNYFWENDTRKTRNTFPQWSKDLNLQRAHCEHANFYKRRGRKWCISWKENKKINKKSHCDLSESNLKATMKRSYSCEFLLELGMGRKGQLSPISLASAAPVTGWFFMSLIFCIGPQEMSRVLNELMDETVIAAA